MKKILLLIFLILPFFVSAQEGQQKRGTLLPPMTLWERRTSTSIGLSNPTDNVGIGTTSPGAKLEIVGSGFMNGDNTLFTFGDGSYGVGFGKKAGGNGVIVYPSQGDLNFTKSSSFNIQTTALGSQTLTSMMYISNAGNVGIATTAPTSTLHNNGSLAYKTHADTNGYNPTQTDHVMFLDASVGGSDIYLPSAATISGRNYIFIKSDNSVDTITLYPNGTESINFTTSYVLTARGKYVSIVVISGNWYVIANN